MAPPWSNRAFGIDSVALYSSRGQFVVLPDELGEVVDDQRNVSVWAIRAAVDCPQASLGQIEEAITHALKRFRVSSRIDWTNTRQSMTMCRHTWPVIAEACRRTVAGELPTPPHVAGVPRPPRAELT